MHLFDDYILTILLNLLQLIDDLETHSRQNDMEGTCTSEWDVWRTRIEECCKGENSGALKVLVGQLGSYGHTDGKHIAYTVHFNCEFKP